MNTTRLLVLVLGLGLFLVLPNPSRAGDFLVILDLSGSMGGAGEMEPAKEALRQAMDQITTPGAKWGLRVYGTHCCTPDTELSIPLNREGREQIREILPGLRGIAGSPMPAALQAAREGELDDSRAFWQRVIIVSDGVVDREGACREARLLREDGVRVMVIGLEYAGTPEGSETLRYIGAHPDCAAGTYLRVSRPDLLTQAMLKLSSAVFGFPYRLIALLLSVIAGYYTMGFFEFALERLTKMRRERIPQLCNAGFLLWMLAGAGLFLGGARPGMLAAVYVVVATLLTTFYLLLTIFKGSVR